MADLPNTMAMDDDPIDWSNNSNTNNTNTNNTIYGYLIRIDTHGEHDTPFILTKPTTTIGRHSNNDIILSASTISSFHAEIEINIPSGYAYLTDLNSTNNTRIGPQLPTIRYSNPSKKANRECIVQSGDYVTFGDIHFIFYHEQDYNSQISQTNVLNNILPTTQAFDEGEIDLKLSQFDDEASPKKVQFDMNNNNNNNDNKHDLEPTLVWDDDDDDNDDQDNNLPATVAFGDDNDNDELINTMAFDDELDVNNNGLNDSGFKSDKNNESGLGISTGNNGGLAATMTIDDCYFGEGDNGKEELDATAKEDNDDNEDMLLATVTMDNDEETEDEEDVNHLPQTVVIDDGDEDSEQTLGVLSGSSNDNNEEIVATMVMGNDNDNDNEDIDLKGVNNNGGMVGRVVMDNDNEDIDLKGVNNNEEHVDNGNTFQSEKTQMNDIFNDMDKEEPTLTMKIDTEDIDLNETNDTFTNDNKHKQELELDNNNNNNNDNHSVDLVNTVVEENNNDNNDNNNEFATTMVIDDDNDDSDDSDNNNNNDNDNHSVDLVNTAVEENNNDNNNEFAATMVIDDDNDNDSVDLVNTVVEENNNNNNDNNDSIDLVNTVVEENENNNDSMDMDIDENNNKQELGSDTEDEELKDNDNNIDTCINTFQSEIPQIDNTNTLHINKQNNNNNNNNIENMVATIKIDTQDIDFDDTNNTNNTNIQSEPLQSEQNEMDEEKEIIASKPIIKPNPPKRRRSVRIAKKSQSMDIDYNNDIQMESKSKSKVKQTNKKRGRKRTVSERDMDENTNPNSNNSISEPPNKKPRRSRRLSSNKNKTKSPTRSASRSASRKSKRLKYNKSNSQSKNDKQIVILWTGPDAKDLQPKLKQLGAKVLKDYNDSVTHLVTTQPRRTKKFLSGMGQTEYIVTETWASQCVRKKTLLIDENKYFPKNKATRDFEGKYGFKLTKSFKKLNERNDGLFTGYKIYFTKDFKKDNKKAIGIMVKSHNGILSSARLPTNVDENIIVIGQNINYKQCKDIKKKGYVVYNKDIIVISILRQEIDFDDDQFILKKN